MIKGKQITINLDTQPLRVEAVKVLEILILGLSDLFEDFFGDDIFGGGSRRSGRRSSNRGSDLRYDLTISLRKLITEQIKVLIILLLKAALDVQEPDRAWL